MFDGITGLVSGGVALDPVFDDHGLTLLARVITQHAGDGDQTLTGTDQSDVLVGGNGNDVLIAGAGNDLLIGGPGHATFVVGSGNDHLVGGAGSNTADFSALSSPVNVNLAAGAADTGAGAHHVLIGIQDIIGTSFADTLVGNARDNVIAGGLGQDVLTGGDGNDTFVLNSPAEGGDLITDFASGKDTICLDAAAFGLAPGVCKAGENFTVVAGHFDGSSAGGTASFMAGLPTLIYSAADHALYFDANGASEGYTTVATLQPGAVLAATDIRVVDHHAIA